MGHICSPLLRLLTCRWCTSNLQNIPCPAAASGTASLLVKSTPTLSMVPCRLTRPHHMLPAINGNPKQQTAGNLHLLPYTKSASSPLAVGRGSNPITSGYWVLCSFCSPAAEHLTLTQPGYSKIQSNEVTQVTFSSSLTYMTTSQHPVYLVCDAQSSSLGLSQPPWPISNHIECLENGKIERSK